MSLRDPDEVGRSVATKLKPIAVVVCSLALLSGPVFAAISWATGGGNAAQIIFLFGYDILVTGAGLLALAVPGHRSPLGVLAYVAAGAAAMPLLLGSSIPIGVDSTFTVTIAISLVIYAIAAVFSILFLARDAAVKATRASGVDTTGTVTRAAVNGMVNYVQHQRLTVKFTDQQGNARYVRAGKVGGGWSAGDTIQVRYNPNSPGRAHSIIVGG